MPNSATDDNQLTVQGYNIVTILKRLEAATSRLEDITIFQEEANQANPTEGAAQAKATKAPASSEKSPSASAAAPTTAAASEPSSSAPTPEATFVDDYAQSVVSALGPFVEASKAIDPSVAEAGALFSAGIDEQARFLALVAKTKRPELTDPAFAKTLAPINEKIGAIAALKDANRRSEFFNHLNTISEGSSVLGWIVSDAPVSYIPEFKDSAQFWANRVMKEYKDKDVKHVNWVKLFLAVFDALKDYAKKYHADGLAWNAEGKPLAETASAELKDAPAPSPGPAAAGGPPPPPPPPPANLFEESKSSGGMTAVFADLNQGSSVTSGLKKVDKSQMTHKNPELRKLAGLVTKPTPPKKPTTLSSVPKKKPARKEFIDGSKWIIENFTEADAPEPIVLEVERTHSVFIGNTSGITVQLKGKGNAVSLSETTKTALVVDSLIAGVDVIKSFKFGLQVTGVVPLVTVDKCEEGSIYLSEASIEAESQVVSSNSTALNINVLQGEDYAELAVPEQLTHTVRNGKLVSEVVEHAG